MYYSANEAYLETRVQSADPVELIRLLYQAAAEAVRDARRHLAAGDIAARSSAISKAVAVFIELNGALDHARGGAIASRLAALYEYICTKLTEANFEQTDAPLAEVLKLINTLSEGWNGVRLQPEPAAVEAPRPWAQHIPAETAQVHAWSF